MVAGLAQPKAAGPAGLAEMRKATELEMAWRQGRLGLAGSEGPMGLLSDQTARVVGLAAVDARAAVEHLEEKAGRTERGVAWARRARAAVRGRAMVASSETGAVWERVAAAVRAAARVAGRTATVGAGSVEARAVVRAAVVRAAVVRVAVTVGEARGHHQEGMEADWGATAREVGVDLVVGSRGRRRARTRSSKSTRGTPRTESWRGRSWCPL